MIAFHRHGFLCTPALFVIVFLFDVHIKTDFLHAEDGKNEFAEACSKAHAEATGISVRGRDGWYFFKGELRHLSVGKFWGEESVKTGQAAQADAKDPLAAIVHYKRQLESNGIELLMVPVPPKAVIFPDVLDEKFIAKDGEVPARLDVQLQEFYKALRAEGVKVLDLTHEFLTQRFDGKAPLYCKTDTHWSGHACALAARAIVKELANCTWFKTATRIDTTVDEKSQAIRGDLLLESDPAAKGVTENIALRFVSVKSDAGLVPVKIDPTSPVLLMSDSHGLVFHIGEELFARGAGLPDQLAHELGFPVDLIASRGDGVSKVRIDLYQRAKSDPAWLAGKKVVIWCFSAREFSESTNGWRKIPVKK